MRRPPPVVRVALLGLLIGAAACGPSERTAREVVERFVEAVQARDLPALRCRFAGAADPASGFEGWVEQLYRTYEEGRDSGGVTLDEEGLLLTKTFALGRGAFWSLDRMRLDGGELTLDTTVRFGYPRIDYSRFSPGTTFYLASTPLGSIEAIRVPARSAEVSAEVLDTVGVRWKLVRQPAAEGCPERWAVLSAVADPDSVSTTRVTWRF
jgi:hypothetical protein